MSEQNRALKFLMKKAICLDRKRIYFLSVHSAVLPLRLADADWDDSPPPAGAGS